MFYEQHFIYDTFVDTLKEACSTIGSTNIQTAAICSHKKVRFISIETDS